MKNESLKKLLVIIAVSTVIYILFRPRSQGRESLIPSFGTKEKRDIIKKPVIDDADLQDSDINAAYTALCAYIDAYNNDESQSDLEIIKEEFKKQLGIEIYTDASGKLAVRNLAGDDILVNS